MKRIYLIRHGEIPGHTPRRFIGQTDYHLTTTGRKQLTRLADYLQYTNINHYFCSPLSRCVESCTLLCSPRQRSFTQIPDLQEIKLGAWEGLTVEEVRRQFPGHYERRGKDLVHFRPEGGESFFDLQQRAWPAFQQIARSTQGTIAIISHAGVNRVILCMIRDLGLHKLFTIDQDYGCMNIIYSERSDYRLETTNFLPPP